MKIEGGELTISALTPEWTSKTADVLTAAFVDSNAAKLKIYRSEAKSETLSAIYMPPLSTAQM